MSNILPSIKTLKNIKCCTTTFLKPILHIRYHTINCLLTILNKIVICCLGYVRKASPDSFVGLRPCSCVDPFYLLFLKIGTNIPNFQFKGQLPPLLNVELNNIFKTCSSWDLHDNVVIAARFFSFLGDLTA